MKPMSNELRKKIKNYIKNGIDIADLIGGIKITGEDLSGAIISRFVRNKDNLARCNFSRCKIGTKGKVSIITNCNLQEAKFTDTIFIGKTFLRRCDARNSDFSGADCSNVEYQFTDFRGAKFCEVLLRLGSSYGLGAKFSQDLFKDLTDGWNIEVKVKED